jgi:DNA-binding protein H-NS
MGLNLPAMHLVIVGNQVFTFAIAGAIMKRREGPMEANLKSMPSEELWKLYEELTVRLSSKLVTEKAMLDERLRQLQMQDHRLRRPYPKVFPKYQNPKNPTETWSGRGRQPRWLSPQLESGKKLDDFRIHNSSGRARRGQA